jgi:hypothetical protein
MKFRFLKKIWHQKRGGKVLKRNIWLKALLIIAVFSVALALASDLTATVVPEPLPIYPGTRISSLPYTINDPGFYSLGGNLTVCRGNSLSRPLPRAELLHRKQMEQILKAP